ncbi:MAG: hypothetical protein PHC92_06920 [Syntrophomonadaceae bacterium]|nr:hypothetical protein [Syntrophomonadaceae bacterium]
MKHGLFVLCLLMIAIGSGVDIKGILMQYLNRLKMETVDFHQAAVQAAN